MATGSFFLLLDDIAAVLDDVAVMTKVAAKKTAGVLGDDLALNANQVSGVRAERELPVVWAVAKGSLLNKAILVPLALFISFYLPSLVIPLLMLGGAYLCFEGVEKIAHKFLHSAEEETEHHTQHIEALNKENIDMVAYEKDKIKGAIRTDFILSAEIIVIALGTVKNAAFSNQIAVLIGISLLMTVGVYGLVGLIVKLDDMGFYLQRQKAKWQHVLGGAFIAFAPKLMKFLSFAGTVAMFTVGGAILVHGIPMVHHAIESLTHGIQNGFLSGLTSIVLEGLFGILAGIVCLIVFLSVTKIKNLFHKK